MFQPWKSDNGAVLPWEYLPAEAGTYHVGKRNTALPPARPTWPSVPRP